MSCAIGISDAPEDIWIIRNAIFRWLNRVLSTQRPDDAELIDRMQKAECLGGISLDMLKTEDSGLANRIVEALLSVSREIADGKHPLDDDHGKPWPELQKQTEESFGELCQILGKWSY